MILRFDASLEFSYHWCGKFTSPNNDWIHITRSRDDYELMVVTDGTLYIADHEREYTVEKGGYLLMAPTPFQHGTRSGGCNFYWLHFGYHNELQDHEVLPDTAEYTPGHLVIPVTGTLSSPERIIILMKQLQDSDRRYKEITLNRYLCSALLSEISAQSCHSLSKDKQPISQIAYSLGFSDAHNFSNAFRKITGLSPSDYRASYNKHNIFQK